MQSTTSNPTQTCPCDESSFRAKLTAFAADIKLSHTLFALPWALLATILAAGGRPKFGQILLILGCMVTARTFAMGANRLFDAPLDAQNPRTARRALPAGKLSPGFVTAILLTTALLFGFLASGFWFFYTNPWPPLLALPVLAFLAGYPFLKRFTRLCHYYLGAALALAPVCAWLAIAGNLAWPPLIMAGAVLLWTAGFDILYACQDYESDVATGVFSVPARLGIRRALWVARLTHLAAVALLITLATLVHHFGPLFYCAVAIAIILLVWEHSLVKPHDLSKLNLAFFTLNGIIAVVIATLGILDIYF